jgi:prolipoprotein diacylglyceryl transferase
LICLIIAEKIARRDGRDITIVWGASFWMVLAAVIGARLYHVIDYRHYYLANPALIFQIWNGGLGILGGIILGGLALFIYLKLHKQDLMYWLNLAALVLPLGQALGRWGNVWNKELLPLAWYEMVMDWILFAILWFVRIKSQKTMMPIYILGYILIRIVTQPMRG